MAWKFNPFTGQLDYYESGEVVVTPESIQFRDDFDDASVYWAWRQNPGSAGTITEAGDVLTLSITSALGRDWRQSEWDESPRIFVGLCGYPAIVETKINSFTVNDGISAYIFASYNPGYDYKDGTWILARERSSVGGWNGLAAWANNVYEATNAVTTMPIWLRLKIGSSSTYYSDRVIMEYSTDGETWVNLATVESNLAGAAGIDLHVGLGLCNKVQLEGGAAGDAPFEYFRMYRDFGPYYSP
jgi:hypothetical protein